MRGEYHRPHKIASTTILSVMVPRIGSSAARKTIPTQPERDARHPERQRQPGVGAAQQRGRAADREQVQARGPCTLHALQQAPHEHQQCDSGSYAREVAKIYQRARNKSVARLYVKLGPGFAVGILFVQGVYIQQY